MDPYARALAQIERRSAASTGYVADPAPGTTALARNLDRTRGLIAALDHPDRKLQIIHVTGSKGKATTSTMAANILQDAGLRVGLFTSPHLHSYRERLVVNGQPILPAAFVALTNLVSETARDLERSLPASGEVNAFELLFSMAVTHFAAERCDIAVLEVGLGGRFDATNVVSPEVCIITHLELEHMPILGTTIAEIAWNKAGIIKPGIPVVVQQQLPAAIAVIASISATMSAPVLLEGSDWNVTARNGTFAYRSENCDIDSLVSQTPGAHQRRNAGAAIAAVDTLRGDRLPPNDEAIRSAIGRTQLPGRFELATLAEQEGQRYLFDVAHTPDSIGFLARNIESLPGPPPIVIAGFLEDKALEDLLPPLMAVAAEVRLVPVRSPRTASPIRLDDLAQRFSAVRFPSLADALFSGNSQSKHLQFCVITGSNAIVAEARELLGIAPPESIDHVRSPGPTRERPIQYR